MGSTVKYMTRTRDSDDAIKEHRIYYSRRNSLDFILVHDIDYFKQIKR